MHGLISRPLHVRPISNIVVVISFRFMPHEGQLCARQISCDLISIRRVISTIYEIIHVNNGNVIGFNGSDKISSLYQFQNSHPEVKNK